MMDYYDERNKLADQVGRLKSALRDIAGSEPIPTDRKAWEFCRAVALTTLASESSL